MSLDQTTVTVIVPAYRRPKALERCLMALAHQEIPAHEILIVIRPEDEDNRDLVIAWQPRLPQLRRVPVVRPGVVPALNAGLAAAGGSIIAFTDDDAEPHPDWLRRIAAHFRSAPDIGGVGGRDLLVELGAPCSERPVGLVRWFGQHVGGHHLGSGDAREVDVLKGVNMSFRRDAIRPVGFDDRLRPGCVNTHHEMGLCLALRKRGWRLIYDPLVAVDHFPAGRMDGSARTAAARRAVSNTAHNETLVIVGHLRPIAIPAFLVWAVAVGTPTLPGILRASLNILSLRALPACIIGRLSGLTSWWRTRGTAHDPYSPHFRKCARQPEECEPAPS